MGYLQTDTQHESKKGSPEPCLGRGEVTRIPTLILTLTLVGKERLTTAAELAVWFDCDGGAADRVSGT